MNEAERSIRDSLIHTLRFLASEVQQAEFAAKVHYDVYQDEFACWWFDTFYPDEPEATAMFSDAELKTLRDFSSIFGHATNELKNLPMSIQALQATRQWASVVAGALEATAKLQGAA